MSPLLSIITVVKDDPHGLQLTLESLTASSPDALADIEWVIIDSSADPAHAKEIVASVPFSARAEWTPPKGVFQAMNVGLELSCGTHVYFLNAGDRLRNPYVLGHLVQQLSQFQPVWLYGQVAFRYPDGTEVIPDPFDYAQAKNRLFAQGRFPPHQGTVVSRSELLALGGFDTSYQVTADFTMMLRLSQRADPLELDEVIAEFSAGGLSEKRWLLSLNEFHRGRLEVFKPRGWGLLREFSDTTLQMVAMSAHRLRNR